MTLQVLATKVCHNEMQVARGCDSKQLVLWEMLLHSKDALTV